MLDFLIIGGGIHGVHLAHVLIHREGLPADAIRILDPHETLLASWSRRTSNTGMRYLRSPRIHHLDLAPQALEQFALERALGPETWIAPYYRPSYALFQQHSQHIIDAYRLDWLHIQEKALTLHRIRGGWQVETGTGHLKARNVVLAMGRQMLNIPHWIENPADIPLQHILSMSFDRQHIPSGATVVVVGAGISAGQITLDLMKHHSITLISRQPLRQHDFDSSPCWLGPSCMTAFAEADYERRRWMIGEARQPGTLSRDVYKTFQRAIEEGWIRFYHGAVTRCHVAPNGLIVMQIQDGTQLVADYMILATGFKPVPPLQTWLNDTILRYELPIAKCGYPVLDRSLRWADGLYAMGPLAELEIGPSAANIVGARTAAERLRQVATS